MNNNMNNNNIMNMNNNNITSDYYDEETFNMMIQSCSYDFNDEQFFIKNFGETIKEATFKRWNMIVNSLPSNYYIQYCTQGTPTERNAWFKKYLDYPTKDISQMPDHL
jgi:hypothetical protein